MILVQALRQFLWSFRLPGEAQKIDRLMESFAKRYCECNPRVFHQTDTCYILSFSIIMLNTSLHNPSVKEKPSLQRFIEMNKGIDEGENLPDNMLISLYNSIKKEPFKIPEDDGNDLMHTFFNPDREGWLWKQGGRYKSWKRRWFIISDCCLYYFEYTTDKEPRGIIPLENVKVREIPGTFSDYKTQSSASNGRINGSSSSSSNLNVSSSSSYDRPNVFEIYSIDNDVIKACKTNSEGRVVEGKHLVYRMSASSPDEARDWVYALQKSITDNPFYSTLLLRRKKAMQKRNERS